ncbi:MAG: thioredoxin family protein [Verrucomicrobiales bacterium]|nr:thioredoxin family protein [Verrucomicrobiales bacterium]
MAFSLMNAAAAPVRDKYVEAELIAEYAAIVPGEEFVVGLKFKLDPTWHTYWINPGAAGTATSIEWDLPEGFVAGDLQFPFPHEFTAFGMIGYGYEKEVIHLVKIKAPAQLQAGQALTLRAKVKWLVCDPQQCVPGSVDLQLGVNVALERGAETPDAEGIQSAKQAVPKVMEGWQSGYKSAEGKVVITIAVGDVLTSLPDDLRIFAETQKILQLGEGAKFSLADGKLVIEAEASKKLPAVLPAEFVAVLHSELGLAGNQSIQIVANLGLDPKFAAVEKAATTGAELQTQLGAGEEKKPMGLGALLLAAFLGGLILNIMPCVFPVISLKIMSFVGQAGESRKRVLAHGLVFTLGILVFFWTLVAALLLLRAGGQQLGWGFQLQSPIFVMGMIVVMFVLSLSLFGVFEFGAKMTGVGGSLSTGKGYAGSFWSGALAVLLATPCTGPFLGPALGYAVSQPPMMSLLVFTVIGLGMAFPYILLSAIPKLLDYVPRPGAWMETFRNLMGFPMLIVVVWLLWVLGAQIGVDGLALFLGALTVLAAAVWLYGKYLVFGTKGGKKVAIWLLVVVLTLGAGVLSFKAESSTPDAVRSSSEPIDQVIAAHRKAGRAVFVDFTAKWCLVCQANKPAMHSEEVQQAMLEKDIVFVVADWTNHDDDITKILAKYGRASVPFYPLFPADPEKEPIILPQNLTKGIILQYLDKLDE